MSPGTIRGVQTKAIHGFYLVAMINPIASGSRASEPLL